MRHHEDETMKADRGGGGKMRVVAAWPTVFVQVVDAGREGSTVTGHTGPMCDPSATRNSVSDCAVCIFGLCTGAARPMEPGPSGGRPASRKRQRPKLRLRIRIRNL